ncbi:hypothetical protein D9M70_597250 [compost metagenome]
MKGHGPQHHAVLANGQRLGDLLGQGHAVLVACMPHHHLEAGFVVARQLMVDRRALQALAQQHALAGRRRHLEDEEVRAEGAKTVSHELVDQWFQIHQKAPQVTTWIRK